MVWRFGPMHRSMRNGHVSQAGCWLSCESARCGSTRLGVTIPLILRLPLIFMSANRKRWPRVVFRCLPANEEKVELPAGWWPCTSRNVLPHAQTPEGNGRGRADTSQKRSGNKISKSLPIRGAGPLRRWPWHEDGYDAWRSIRVTNSEIWSPSPNTHRRTTLLISFGPGG